ncbi:hypothetical protein FACS1894181_16340 [Bacteroidia bacterium]|nr:hypothetical protein FACS1894181_16340 [Bacteroidia bacterium]
MNNYTYTLYEDGKAVFNYTNAPSYQSDSYGTYGDVYSSGSDYAIRLTNTLLSKNSGTYTIKVKITNGTQSIFTAEKTVTVR